MAIAAAHEPPAAVDVLAQWWNEARPGFSVARDSTGGVAGFSVLLDASATSVPSLLRDPVTRVWRRHLRDHPVAPDERVLFIRRWLDAEAGDAPSAVQAACWLDMKRTYLALRPALRRVYLVVADLEPYAAVAGRLGFVPLADVADLGGKPYASAVLDFGPGSVDGWLARLVADELGIEPAIGLDTRAGEARIDGRRIRLTKREFGVLERLRREPGRVVTRPTLLRDVWGYEYAGGSNVVDSAVRSLRAKLGSRAAAVETVRGRGYRLRE
jgi:transcriptional regulator